MSKCILFIMALCASLCSLGSHAQEILRRVISLEEMYTLADQHSKSLRPGATAVNEAGEAVKIARSARLPEIQTSLALSYLGDARLIDRNFSHSMNAPMPHFGNNFSLEVSQILYSGGAVTASIELARLGEKRARLALDEDRNRVRFQLTGYYLDLYKQHNLLQVYEKNIEQTRQVLQEIRIRCAEGMVLKNDITRYELLLANLELAHTQIQNSLEILNSNLTTMLGIPAGVWITPDTTLLSRLLPVENGEYWETFAVNHSLPLKQMSVAVEANEQQEKLIKSEFLPKVALVAADFLDGPVTIEVPPINKNLNYWYLGVGVRYNLSSVYKTNKQVSKHRYTTQRTLEQYDDLKEQTELAAKADFIKYKESYEQLSTHRKNVELAHQNYGVILNRYQNDMALITDMLDASTSKLSAEVELANARIGILFNYYKLLYISGTL